VENSGIGYLKLLVARGYKGDEIICERVWFLSKKQKMHRTTSWQIDAKFYSNKTLDAYISGFHYQAAFSTRIWLYPSSYGLVNQNSILYIYYREDIGRRIDTVVQE